MFLLLIFYYFKKMSLISITFNMKLYIEVVKITSIYNNK